LYVADYVVVAMYGASVGNVAISKIDACVNQACCVLTPGNINDIRFLYYWLVRCKEDLIQQSFGGGQPNISQEKIKNEPMLSLPLFEQTLIADYLDEQCEKIDSIASDLEKQIEIFQKYKKSLITETVTKGLDKSVHMKNSGFEWIGEIPEHWEVKKMKLVSNQIGDIDHYMPESVDIGIPYVMTGDFIGDKNEIDFENCKKISNQDFISLSRKIKPQKGDVLFARYATIGTVRYVEVDIDFLVSYACLIIKPTLKIMNGKFLYYYCFSDSFAEEVSKFINTNTQANVGSDSLNRVKITVPPLEEQNQIANHLDQQCLKIDSIIESKKEQLTIITQQKKSLIYEYVTGKRRVKGESNNGN
jgi:type I restriction enzyme S subunit